MAAGKWTTVIEQGSTFDIRIEYLDSEGSPVDLSNYSARMHIRPAPKSSTLYAALSSPPASDGTGLTTEPYSGSVQLPASSGSIGIYISAASTSMFDFNEAHYDLEIYSGSGVTEYVKRILDGKIRLSKEVTF